MSASPSRRGGTDGGVDAVPLEMSSRQRLELGTEALRYLDQFISARQRAPASFPMPDRSVLDELRRPPAADGTSLTGLLELLDTAAVTGIDTSAGSHLSYIPNGGLYAGAVGELLAAGMNRYTGGVHASPGATAIEQGVIDWMLGLFGWGPDAAGVLLSGGSLANFTAIVTARACFDGDEQRGAIYTSARAHHSVHKSARLAGIADHRVREVAVDTSLRLDVDALETAIASDIADGLRPLAVVGSAGTTDTGTIDPLGDLAAIAARYGTWYHVDAAYGGFFQLTDRGAQRLAGIEQADSITVDAHKSLFLPYGVGGLLVRDGAALAAAHTGRGGYMQDVVDLTELPHYFALGPELTRPFRGLPVWLALHLHGVDGFRDELDRMLDLAEHAQRELRALSHIELATPPDLSVVAFRSRHGDAASQQLFDRLNASRRVHVSSTTVDGRFTVRLAFLNPRTTRDHLDAVIQMLQALA